VADIIAHTLMPSPDVEALQARVHALTSSFPLYPELG
jgi:glycine hydroxymethyltransferase